MGHFNLQSQLQSQPNKNYAIPLPFDYVPDAAKAKIKDILKMIPYPDGTEIVGENFIFHYTDWIAFWKRV